MKIGASNWNQPLGLRPLAAQSTSPAEDDPQLRRLRQQQEGLEKLKSMPANSAQEKAAYLQKRLMELKAMLLHASPQQAKALLQELRSIAGGLASVAKAGAGAGADSSGDAGAAEAANAAQVAAVASAGTGSSLEGLLSEARQALKDVLAMIKSKLANAPRTDREAVQDVEQKLAELDNAMAQGDASSDLYTAVGAFMDFSGASASASMSSINITV